MRILVCVVLCVVVAGCQTVKHTPLNEASAAQLQGKTFAVAKYPKPDFAAFTAGKAAFAVIGAAAMIGAGNELVKKHNIEDPAVQIGETLALQLSQQKGMQRVETQTVAKAITPAALITSYPGVNYIMDVGTFNWMFAYYPTNWNHYRVIYNVRFRLIDTATKKPLTETTCATVQGDDKNPPSKEQLLENDAALLKALLAKAAVTCTDLLSRELLKLSSPGTPTAAAVPAPKAVPATQ